MNDMTYAELESDKERFAYLEWATYAAQMSSVARTFGVTLTMADTAIIETSIFPMPDVNHACLVRASEDSVDSIIDGIIRRFRRNPMPPRVFVSPSCEPPDLVERLRTRGFAEQENENEAWVALDLLTYQTKEYRPGAQVKRVDRRGLYTWCKVFCGSFGMDWYYALPLYLMMRPSAELPEIRHYLALKDDQPAGVCSLMFWRDVVVLGSFGVLPQFRGRKGGRVAFILGTETTKIAQAEGKSIMVLQTTSSRLERYLHVQEFVTLFRRPCYVKE